MIRGLYYKLKHGVPDKIHRVRFSRVLKEIWETPPVESRDDGLVILSMVSHKDLLMYLLAAKSLNHYLKRGRFEVINDGTLTKEDMLFIIMHIKGVKCTDFKEIQNNKCPKNGVWERLLYAGTLAERENVLIVDSDILTQGPVPELEQCIDNNRSYIIGVKPNQEIRPMKEVWLEQCQIYKNVNIEKLPIQSFFDTHLDKIPGFEILRYLKASNGFNGFARGSISRASVEEVSKKMEAVFNRRWHEWGTEQIAACLLVANSGNGTVLPYPKYGLYYAIPGVDYDACSVIHFIGTHRYKKWYYSTAAKKIIRDTLRNTFNNNNKHI